jgi:hypothetical protein
MSPNKPIHGCARCLKLWEFYWLLSMDKVTGTKFWNLLRSRASSWISWIKGGNIIFSTVFSSFCSFFFFICFKSCMICLSKTGYQKQLNIFFFLFRFFIFLPLDNKGEGKRGFEALPSLWKTKIKSCFTGP